MMASADEQQIERLFEDGDRALMAVNVPELECIYADDYVQYDEYGIPSTRQDLIRKLTSGEVRFVAMKSTGRQIRFLRNDVALVHGAEEDQVERNGKREFVRYVFTDVVMKRSDRWEIVASQLARIE